MELQLKCIKTKCDYYNEVRLHQEVCQLISKRVLLDKCYGLDEIPDKREEIACRIQKLTQEFVYLTSLENLVKENQELNC